MSEDSVITKLATHLIQLGRTYSSTDALRFAALSVREFEQAGLVVTDPTQQPYSLVTHEYPPTLELARAQIDYLANTNHALHMHLRAAWDRGHAAGASDVYSQADDPQGVGTETPNPYRQETTSD